MQASKSSYHQLSRRQLVWTIVGLQVTLLLAALDQTIVSTAMPKIIAELNGFERYSWVTTAYLLTSTATLPVFGKLSDIHGRKWLLLVSAVGFVLASALCGLSGTLPRVLGDGMTQLIIFRGLQGVFGGGIMALVFTAIGDLFPPAERGKYQGLFSAVWALASVVGPLLGGWITDSLTWRWVFYVNLPVGALAVGLLYFAFPHTAGATHKRALDVAGLLTLVGWVVPLLLGLTWAPQAGPTMPVILSFVIAICMFFAFVFAELRAEEPIVPLTLFTNPIVSVSCASLLFVGIGMFGAILFAPLYFQAVLGSTATQSGSELMPMMLMITIGSALSGQLISRLDRYKVIALIGLATMSCGLFLMSRFDVHTPHMVAMGCMFMLGSGLGLLMPIYTIVVQNAVSRNMIGVATSATQFFRSIGGTLGAAIFNSVLLLRFNAYFKSHLPSGTPDAAVMLFHNPLSVQHNVGSLSTTLAGIPNGFAIQQQLLTEVKQAFSWSLDAIFLVGAIIMLACFFLNFFLKEVPLRKAAQEPGAAPADMEVILPTSD